MKLIPPVLIDDAKLVSSSLAESDYPVWNAGTVYAVGARCILLATHCVYQRLTAGSSPTSPDLDSVNWLKVGPTNRWAMFDEAVGSASTASGSLTVTVAPGMANSLALLDAAANKVTVTRTRAGIEVYRKVVSLYDGSNVFDGYSYCFEPIVMRTTVVLTDMPPYPDGEITIHLEGPGEVALGTFVVGTVYDLGKTRYGVGLGGIDYSVKSTDAFGVTTVSERAEASRMTVPFVVDNRRLDNVMRMLKSRRAKPSVWIGARRYDSAIVYGYAKDRQVLIPYDQVSECSVTIEGLV